MNDLIHLAVEHWPLAIIVLLVAWIALSLLLAPFFGSFLGANGTRPEEDEAQFRYVLEHNFIAALDKCAKYTDHQIAWGVAVRAARREPDSTHNIKQWSNAELLRAIHDLKA